MDNKDILTEYGHSSGAKKASESLLSEPTIASLRMVLEDGRHYTLSALARRLNSSVNDVASLIKENPDIVRSAGYRSRKSGEEFFTSANIKPSMGEYFSRFTDRLNEIAPI